MYANFTNFYNDVHLCNDQHKPLGWKENLAYFGRKVFEKQNKRLN